ncbi:hypothetical protein DFH09DRAFT_1421241, partial [Mycena vulgaris]
YAGPNHCDFLFHFSNSSYATALDVANFRFAIATFPNFLRCGGWALLTGVGLILLYTHSSRTVPIKTTHYHFIRKIPMSSSFEMRVRIGAWDDKWVRIHHTTASDNARIPRASPSPRHSPTALQRLSPTANPPSLCSHPSRAMRKRPRLTAPCCTVGPSPCSFTADNTTPAVAVSHLRDKLGRRTFPSAILLAANGFYAPP